MLRKLLLTLIAALAMVSPLTACSKNQAVDTLDPVVHDDRLSIQFAPDKPACKGFTAELDYLNDDNDFAFVRVTSNAYEVTDNKADSWTLDKKHPHAVVHIPRDKNVQTQMLEVRVYHQHGAPTTVAARKVYDVPPACK